MLNHLEVQELCIRIIHAGLSQDEEMVNDLCYRLMVLTDIEDETALLIFIDRVMSKQTCHN